ncbi:MAG: acyl-CoA synthetase FdrA [Chloroflexi bacterium]|nr:acyl-CoA synthetase FdrA [Chloroflexota bacterium]
MPVAGLVKTQTYRDSVALMVLSTSLGALPGVRQASVMMGTPANKAILAATGLASESLTGAGPNDLCIAVDAEDAGALEAALTAAEAGLARGGSTTTSASDGRGTPSIEPRTLEAALRVRPDATLAVISVPGDYAATEARRALSLGLHVFLFSDNVALSDEIDLKRIAEERGLLVMGPDCGTALIGGVPLGFTNAVRAGSIGVVGASGTGIQEVTSLIHRLGGGVSHALGTGGRDLVAEVGGRTFLAALSALASDETTQIVVAIAKLGDPAVEARVVEALAACGKPAVVYFLGAPSSGDAGQPRGHDAGRRGAGQLVWASDLEHVAECAVALERDAAPPAYPTREGVRVLADRILADLGPHQRHIRGLFAGGTLAQESAVAIARALGASERDLHGSEPGEVLAFDGHRILDLGDDAYTRGRPHPLIDPRVRNAELLAQAASGEVALVLLDVILGSGVHPDPAAALLPAVAQARAAARMAGATLHVLASVCGTDADPQGYTRQRAALEAGGVLVARSSSEAAAVAARVAQALGALS